MGENAYQSFRNLTFEAFRKRAADPLLTASEKIGFPDSYRAGKEKAILADITDKVHNLGHPGRLVVDIGVGCGGLAFELVRFCQQKGHTLLLIDSEEMLNHLPNHENVVKIAGRFPECQRVLEPYNHKIDVVLVYSVLHHVFAEANYFDFLDAAVGLLADGGEMLIGDIPNNSKRRRFFASANGIRFHQGFTGTDDVPQVVFNTLNPNEIDDAVVLSICQRYRNSGFDVYIVPQKEDLPMANRREDILIRKP